MRNQSAERAIAYYLEARNWLVNSPYYGEAIWQARIRCDQISECQLLREHAWVVLNSGFRESTIRARFDYISLCFCDWESATAIVEAGEACIMSAWAVFKNRRKLSAIVGAASAINTIGFDRFSAQLMVDPVSTLRSLPYVGPVTVFHLAKNLGFDVVKPDRHLVRLATHLGYDDVSTLCREVSVASGDEESMVDLVLWRFQQQVSAGLWTQR